MEKCHLHLQNRTVPANSSVFSPNTHTHRDTLGWLAYLRPLQGGKREKLAERMRPMNLFTLLSESGPQGDRPPGLRFRLRNAWRCKADGVMELSCSGS